MNLSQNCTHIFQSLLILKIGSQYLTYQLFFHLVQLEMEAFCDMAEETLLEAMLEHPVLVNRPIVCSPRGVRLCRPSETVLDLLEALPPGPVYKEDGALLIDERGDRVG